MSTSTRRRAAILAAALVAPVLAGLAVPAGASERRVALGGPTALAASGGTLFVANRSAGTITLLNAASGALEGVTPRSTVGVGAPIALAAASGTYKGRAWHTVLVAAAGGAHRLLNFVVRKGRPVLVALGSTRSMGCGAKSRVFVGVDAARDFVVVCSNGATWTIAGRSGLSGHSIGSLTAGMPVTSIAVAGATLLETVGSEGAAKGSAAWAREGVLQVSLATRTLVGSLTNATCPGCGFDDPDGVAVSGSAVWVSDAGDDQATQLSSGPLAFVGTQTSNLYGTGVAIATKHAVYLASVDGPGNSMVTMFTTSPVAYQWMMCNSNDAYRFDDPSSLALASGAHGTVYLWVANPADNLVDQMDATSGALIRTVS